MAVQPLALSCRRCSLRMAFGLGSSAAMSQGLDVPVVQLWLGDPIP
jgi:hypothetical protein